MVESFGIDVDICDGNDLEECFKVAKRTTKYVRENCKPYFLEFFTYRHREHCGPNFDNNLGYRSEEEFNRWKLKDPLDTYKKFLIQSKICSLEEIESYELEIVKEVQNAFEFAENSSFPAPDSLANEVYSKLKI